jgi:anaerobic selenocysteine-containing dehydrogenase
MAEREKWRQYHCVFCVAHCSLFAKVEKGMIRELKGDNVTGFPSNYCPKHKGSLLAIGVGGVLRNKNRLKYPLVRREKRGENKWKRVSWDEALSMVAEKLLEFKEKYGPESVALLLNEPKGLEFAMAQRFATAFGTPNVFSPGNYCGVPTISAFQYTFGSQYIHARTPIYHYAPRVVILWGTNLLHTGGSFNKLRRRDLHFAMERGAKVVVIDPKNIDLDVTELSPDPTAPPPRVLKRASDADYWLKPRPGSDGILAMGMIKVIVEEELYDRDYIENWTLGFDKLQEHVKSFTLDDVEKLTWVPASQIQDVARLYAKNKPGIIAWGNGLEQTSTAFQTCRAIAILRGITGNVNTPDGGEAESEPAPMMRPGHFIFGGELKERLKEFPRSPDRTIGSEFKIAFRSAYVPTQMLVKSVLEGKPYPVKAVIVILSNPLASYPDTERVREAFMKLDFVVVADVFHTPTTAFADVVLPAATFLEHDDIGYWPAWFGDVRAYPRLLDPPGEARPDTEIINELAKKVGLEKYFFKNESEILDYWLKPANLTYKEFAENVGAIYARSLYNPFKVIGYKTPSGKVEIYSQQLEEMGISPMPRFEEFVEAIKRFEPTEEYPILMTNGKEELYILTGFRNLTKLNIQVRDPIARLNPETARKLGLKDGDWVYIETKNGRVKQKLITDSHVDPRVVLASFGWWEESCLNLITDSNPPYDPATGSPHLKGIPSKVCKA